MTANANKSEEPSPPVCLTKNDLPALFNSPTFLDQNLCGIREHDSNTGTNGLSQTIKYASIRTKQEEFVHLKLKYRFHRHPKQRPYLFTYSVGNWVTQRKHVGGIVGGSIGYSRGEGSTKIRSDRSAGNRERASVFGGNKVEHSAALDLSKDSIGETFVFSFVSEVFTGVFALHLSPGVPGKNLRLAILIVLYVILLLNISVPIILKYETTYKAR